MSLSSSHSSALGKSWLASAVLSLDEWLRSREDVHEFTTDPECILRARRSQAEQSLALSDGTLVRCGDPILELHIWNEQMPAMDAEGPTVAWARRASAAFRKSLVELAKYMQGEPELDAVRAIRADMALAVPEQNEKLTRILVRHGFERVDDRMIERSGAVRRLGENVLMLLLVLASNPAAARITVLRRERMLFYLPRSVLESRYLPPEHWAVLAPSDQPNAHP